MILNIVVSTIPGIDASAPDTPIIFGAYKSHELARQVALAAGPNVCVGVIEVDYIIPSIRRQLEELKQNDS